MHEPIGIQTLQLVRNSLPELKDLGVNTINILPHYKYAEGKFVLNVEGTNYQISGEKAERFYIDLIVKIKKAGFAVQIWPLYHQGGRVPIFTDLDCFEETVIEQAKMWAMIAEAYNVEYFAPNIEYENYIRYQNLPKLEAIQRINDCNNRVLLEVRPMFTGEMVRKSSIYWLQQFDFPSASGFDMLGACFGLTGDQNPEVDVFRQQVQQYFKDAQMIAERDYMSWMVGEFWLIEGVRTAEEDVQLYRIVMEEYQKQTN